MFRTVFFLVVLCSLSLSLHATHIYGGYFSYHFIDSFTIAYEIRMESDCGVGNSIDQEVQIRYQTDTGIIKFDKRVYPKAQFNASRLCPQAMANRCDQFNMLQGGIKSWIFADTIFLKNNSFRIQPDSIKMIEIRAYITNRYRNHTTIDANSGGLIYLKLHLKNRMGQGPKPRILLPVLQDELRYNPSFSDPDNDSLSFILVKPLDGNNNNITYKTPHQLPVTAWFAPGFQFPQSHPNNSPPSGFFFDQSTGELVYTINKTENGPLNYLVKEWGIDENGKRYVKSESVFEQLISSKAGQSNFAPQIQGADQLKLTEGDTLDIQYSGVDRPYPISLGKFLHNDTVRDLSFFSREPITYNWQIADSTALHVSGRLRRVFQIGDSKHRWYQFYIKAQDNDCPSPMISVKTVNLEVRNQPSVSLQIDSLGCGKFLFRSIPDSTNMGRLNYLSRIHPLTPHSKGFVTSAFSSGSQSSNNSQDTVFFFRQGDYEITHVINYPGFDRKVTYTDTIFFRDSFPELFQTEDTFYCHWDSLQLSLDSLQFVPHSLKWSFGERLIAQESEVSVKLKQAKREILMVEAESRRSGCAIRDWLYVSEVPSFEKVLGNDTFPCKPFELVLKLPERLTGKWAQKSILWSDNSRSDSIIVSEPGNYWVNVENYCGHYTDSLEVIDAHQRSKTYPDQYICIGDTIEISSSLNVPTYRWNTGDTTKSIKVHKSGLYRVTVQSVCNDPFIQFFRVKTHRPPQLFLQDFIQSCDTITEELLAGNADEFTKIIWSDSLYSGSFIRPFDAEGTFVITAQNLCGTFKDSIDVFFPQLPERFLPGDSVFCLGDSVHIHLNDPPNTLQWEGKLVSDGIWLKDSGHYQYAIVNQCDTLFGQLHISLKQRPLSELPNDTILPINGQLVLGPEPVSGVKYLWSTMDTSSNIIVSQAGWYSLIMQNECGVKKDSILVRSNLSATPLQNEVSVKVYPIPVMSELILDVQEPLKRVEIINAFGQVVWSRDFLKQGKVRVQTELWNDGMFLISCQHVEGNIALLKIIKTHH
jgi:hypothetical protein